MALAPSPPLAFADFPLPSFTFYGEVRNAYGQPYTQVDKAELIVRAGGRECGRTTVDERLGPGSNYRVEVPLDNGQGELYAPFAARPGDQPAFVIRVGSQEYAVMDPTNAPPVGAPGSRLRLNFFRDTDCDYDGIPDSWMTLFFGHATALASDHSRAQDDHDGDGMSNLQEFLAGTDPSWDVDRLEIDKFVYLPQINRFGLGYYSVRAKSYQVLGASPMPQWQEMDFSVNTTNNVPQQFWRGDGYYSWLYVDALTNSYRMFRLKAQ